MSSIMRALQEWIEKNPDQKVKIVNTPTPPPIPITRMIEEDIVEIASRPYARGYLTGRCANGAERDSGTLRHLLPMTERGHSWKAVCGASPGRRSAGWNVFKVEGDWAKDCEKCKRRAERIASKEEKIAEKA